MDKLGYFREYFKYLENPISVLKFKFGLANSCELKIKNKNDSLFIDNENVLNEFMLFLPYVPSSKYDAFIDYYKRIAEDDEVLDIDGVNYVNIYNKKFIQSHPIKYAVCCGEYFTDDDWDVLNYKNRDIIDIGANAADTALYFAKNGGRNIIAFEPVKHLYDLALENISLNPSLKDNIKFVNKAVGGKRGTLDTSADSLKGYVDDSEDYLVEIITVNDILEDYDIQPDILKMDCEV